MELAVKMMTGACKVFCLNSCFPVLEHILTRRILCQVKILPSRNYCQPQVMKYGSLKQSYYGNVQDLNTPRQIGATLVVTVDEIIKDERLEVVGTGSWRVNSAEWKLQYNNLLTSDRHRLAGVYQLGTFRTFIRHHSDSAGNRALRNILSKFKKNKQLEKKMIFIKKMETMKEAVDHEMHQSKDVHKLEYLIYGCQSPKHLLDLILPWLERGEVSVDDDIRILEQLISLTYQGVIEKYPNMPHTDIPQMFKMLRLIKEDKNVFEPVLGHPAMVLFLVELHDRINYMNKSQFAITFSYLTHLGVSKYAPVLTKCYERLVNGDHSDYSPIDLAHLYKVLNYENNFRMLLIHMSPKLKICLSDLEKWPKTFPTFKSLLFFFNLNWAMLVHLVCKDCLRALVFEIYDCSTRSGYMNEAQVATEILENVCIPFQRWILTDLMDVLFSSEEQLSYIQHMRELAVESLEIHARHLLPQQMETVLVTVNSWLSHTRVKYLLQKRAVDLIENTNLTLYELVTCVNMLGTDGVKMLNNAAKTEILLRLKNVDLFCFLQIARQSDVTLISSLMTNEFLTEKMILFSQSICELDRPSLLSEVFKVDWFLFLRKIESTQDQNLSVHIQKIIEELILKYSYDRVLKGNFIAYLTRCKYFTSTCVDILGNIYYNKVSNIGADAHMAVQMKQLVRVGNPLISGHSDYRQSEIYKKHRSLMYIISLFALKSYYSKPFNVEVHTFKSVSPLIFVNILNLKPRVDLLYKYWIMRKYLEYMEYYPEEDQLKMMHRFAASIPANVYLGPYMDEFFRKSIVLLTSHSGGYRSKMIHCSKLSKLLIDTNFDVSEDETLRPFVHDIMENCKLPNFKVSLVNTCNYFEIPVDEAIQEIFTQEFLEHLDNTSNKLSATAVNHTKRSLFLLNQTACIEYPHLHINWIQGDDQRICYEKSFVQSWRDIPADVDDAITHILGGDQFIGKELYGEYGLALWRVILQDSDGRPVKFTEHDMKYAHDLDLNRIVFQYHFNDLSNHSNKMTGDRTTRSRLLTKLGYTVVNIFATEWNSMGLVNFEDKIQFLRSLYNEDSTDREPLLPAMSCDHMSSQWSTFLNDTSEKPGLLDRVKLRA